MTEIKDAIHNAQARGRKQRSARLTGTGTTPTGCTIPMLVLLAILLFATVASAASLVEFYKYVIDHPNVGEVTYIYDVTSLSDPAISHTSFMVESCYEARGCGIIVDGVYLDTACENGYDPTTEIEGVKFEDEIEPGETVRFWFAVYNPEQRSGDTQAATKSGQIVEYFDVTGPVCDPNAVTLSSLTATQKDNAVLIAISLALAVAAVAVALFYVAKSIKN